MGERLAMMHVTPVVLSLDPTSVKLLFHNQICFKKKVVAQTTKSKHDRNHHPYTDKF